MRALLFTTGSLFARAVRIILDELGLDYERREEITTPGVAQWAAASLTQQVPTFWDDGRRLWESGTIAEYLLTRHPDRPPAEPPLARHAFRPEAEWDDKLIFSTIQTFGTAATTISQLTWSGVRVGGNAHLDRSAERLAHMLGRLDDRPSFRANPVWWWEPGVTGYRADGTPVYAKGDGTG